MFEIRVKNGLAKNYEKITMKLILLAILFFPSERLLDAIEYVESRGNTQAIGDNGQAVGCMQIHKIYVDDVNRILGHKAFNYDDRFDREKSKAMVMIYTSYWAARSGQSTSERFARIHNGGPQGYKKETTKKYWLKVQARLKFLNQMPDKIGQIHYVDKLKHPDNTIFRSVYGMVENNPFEDYPIYIKNRTGLERLITFYLSDEDILLHEIAHSYELNIIGWTDEDSVKKTINLLKSKLRAADIK